MSHLDVQAGALNLGARSPLTFSKGDFNLLGRGFKQGVEIVLPTSALCSLHFAGRNSPIPSSFDTLAIASSSPRGKQISHEWLNALDQALESLTKLDTPLVKSTQDGYLHAKKWALTEKGHQVAKTIRDNTVTIEAPLLEQGEASFRVLCRALGVDGGNFALNNTSMPALPSAAKLPT